MMAAPYGGQRKLIPDLGREAILQKLHCGHPGITKYEILV